MTFYLIVTGAPMDTVACENCARDFSAASEKFPFTPAEIADLIKTEGQFGCEVCGADVPNPALVELERTATDD